MRIFISYSHRDPQYLGDDSLVGFLRGLEAEEGVEFWTDQRLEGGTFWDEEIQKRLRESDIALVLVSQGFLDSPYCTSVEMSAFLARCREDGLIIFPVILSPCEWDRHEWLASRQFLPGGGETIEEHYAEPGKRKRLFLKIRQELRSAIARARERVRPEAGAAAEAAPAGIQQLAERRQLTILQCALAPTERDGTPVSDEDLPEILHELAPEFLRVASQVFDQFGGHIVRSGGSTMVVYFGYPVALGDDSRRAVHAGQALIATLGKLNAKIEQELGVRLAVRVGIHTGVIIAGGGAAADDVDDSELTALISRVQEAAVPDAVVITETTRKLVQNYFTTAPAGNIPLPQSRQIAVFRILRDTGHSRVTAAVAKGLTPLVGRDKELALLLDRWADARAGKGQVVLLRSEAGVGKSRVLAEVKKRTATDSLASIECRCSPYHQNTSLYAVGVSLESWFGFEQGDDDAAKLAKIERTVQQYGTLEELVPPLAKVMSVPAPQYPVSTASPQEQKQLALEIMVQLVVELAAETPVLFIVEDLHWVDPSTVEFLDLLIDQASAMPLLLLLAFRPEYTPPPQWLNRENASQIALDRLGREEAQQMVLAVAGGKPLPPQVFDEIYQKTEGFPLFIEDLTTMVLESDLVVEREDRYELVGPFHSLAIPDTLQETLMARLAKLATAKPVAQIGATIGREFVFDMLREVGGFVDKALTEGLNQLVQAGLLYRRGMLSRAKYVFKHALVQEALQQSLLKKQRRQYHRVITGVLEEKFHEVAESQPELVAYHCEEGGLPDKAAEYWQRAAGRALSRGANREALSQVERAVENLAALPDDADRWQRELDLRMIAGPALVALRGAASVEVGRCYARAQELCALLPQTKTLFGILRGVWTNDIVAARLHQALTAAEKMHAVAQASDDENLLLQSHAMLCDTLWWLGRPADALAHAQAGLELYDFESHYAWHCQNFGEDPAPSFYSYGVASLNLFGRRREAQQRVDEAQELLERFTHLHSRGFLLFGVITHYVDRRDVANALSYTQKMMEMAVEHHLEAWNTLATFWQGWAMAFQGELDRGLELMAGARRRWHESGAGVEACWFPALMAELLLPAGRFDEALQWIEAGFATARTNDDVCQLSELYRLKGEALEAKGGDSAAIAEAFQTALRISAGQEAAVLSLRTAGSLARHLLARGRSDEAKLLLTEACNAYRGDDDTPELLAARALLQGVEEKVGV
ncbi:MAG TPA: AAA family ATPase [Thermoanaerobaculia bacterium]|nr:AAA family ATPase [Thermoanaerobaculia bacterium]